MKCANHPAADATAYCQHCGKPLCAECIRAQGERILCESCAAPGAAAAVPSGAPSLPNPALAAVLGFIPGVGAMYNGQLAKALAHVILFAIFVALSHISVIFALLVPAWIFYQVFEAYQTAKARMEGRPVPDHLGLNQIGAQWFGGSPETPTRQQPKPPETPELHAAEPSPGIVPYPPAEQATSVKEPAWAVALIIFGLLLLLKTLGIPETNWIGRSWPVLFAIFGAYLLTRSFARAIRSAPSGWPRLAHNAWGPAFLILLGILWSLDRWSLFGLHKSWPLFLILAGLLILFERLAASWSGRRADEATEQGNEAI